MVDCMADCMMAPMCLVTDSAWSLLQLGVGARSELSQQYD